MATADVKLRLRTLGLRATTARAAVYSCLLEAGGPLTHSEVCDKLEKDGLDRATVYRNLADLTEAKVLRRVDHGDHLWRFELAHGADEHGDAMHHPHFVCTDCGTVACLPEETVKLVKAALPGKSSHKEIEIQIRGQCDGCSTE